MKREREERECVAATLIAACSRLEVEGRKDGGKGAMSLPYLDEIVEDLPALNTLSTFIMQAV